jgi:4-amino-4-deoxy-L-arabinose transferase-like glycosyltransferase
VGVFFFDLNGFNLQSPDEGRYAEASREMLASGDWLVPRFADHERVNKPPMVYWVTATLFKVFGLKEWVARLGPTLAGLGGALVVFLLGRTMFGQSAGVASAVVAMAATWYVALSRSLVTDMMLSTFIALTLLGFWWAHQSGQWKHYLLFFAGGALATLTKGPVGFALPALVAVLHLTLTRQWRNLAWGKFLVGCLVYLLIAAPWFIAVQMRYPKFLHYFLVGENLARYGGRYHGGYPIYFYALVILVGAFPWTPYFVATAWRDAARSPALRRNYKRAASSGQSSTPTPPPSPTPILFLWLWFAVIFVFFTLGKGKLATYVLPCFPALALIVGKEWAGAVGGEGAASAPERWMLRASWWLNAVMLGMLVGLVALMRTFKKLPPQQMIPTGVWVISALLIGSVLCAVAARRGTLRGLFVATALTGVIFTLGTWQGAKIILRREAVAPLVERIAQRADADDLIIEFRDNGKDDLTSFHFYVGRAFGSSRRIIDLPPLPRPDIYGDHSVPAEPSPEESYRAATAELLKLVRSGKGVFCLIKKEEREKLKDELAAARCDILLGENRKYALVTNKSQ